MPRIQQPMLPAHWTLDVRGFTAQRDDGVQAVRESPNGHYIVENVQGQVLMKRTRKDPATRLFRHLQSAIDTADRLWPYGQDEPKVVYEPKVTVENIADPRIGQFFHHLREALNLAEMVLKDFQPFPKAPPPPRIEMPMPRESLKMDYMGIKQIVARFGRSRTTWHRLLTAKAIKAKKAGRSTLIEVRSVEQYLANCPNR